jgi:hypothetical protein
MRRPIKYSHLVEQGHIDAKTKKHVPGKPFLRPAFDETQSQVGEQIMGDIWAGIVEEAK